MNKQDFEAALAKISDTIPLKITLKAHLGYLKKYQTQGLECIYSTHYSKGSWPCLKIIQIVFWPTTWGLAKLFKYCFINVIHVDNCFTRSALLEYFSKNTHYCSIVINSQLEK